MTTTKIIPKQTIVQLVATYEESLSKAKEAFSLLDKASKENKAIFGSDFYWLPTQDANYGATKRRFTESVWRYIFKQTGIDSLLTETKSKLFTKQIHDGDMPEITVANVMGILDGILDGLRCDAPALLQETVTEVFRWLTPPRREYDHYNDYSDFQVGKKVIVRSHDTRFNMVEVNQWALQRLRSLDNVFHLLDGKGVAEDNLVIAIRTAIREQETTCETEYFSCKWNPLSYLEATGSTIHITFKKQELVDDLNRKGAAGRQELKRGA